jgi:hypothetical protein
MSEEPREYTAAPPTEEEDRDLVALLDEGRGTERFGLPMGGGQVSDEWWIEVRRWTAGQKKRYDGAGMDWRASGRGKAAQAIMRADPEVQLKVLCEESIVGLCLKVEGRAVKYPGAASVWDVVSQVHPAIGEWIERTLRRFQGLEVTGQGEAL